MKQAFMAIFLAAALLAAGPILAQEKSQPGMHGGESGMMGEMMQGKMAGPQPPMMIQGMQVWWNMGVMSQKLGQLLEEAGEILGQGNLAPETQKKLGGLMQDLARTASEMFAPQSPEKQQEYLNQLGKLKEQLEALEKTGKPKKGGK